jgi:PAS domain S-box-containing protein
MNEGMAHRDPSLPMPTILRYGIAVLSVAIGIGLDFLLLRHFDAKLTPFLFAVAATVWYAGTGPGVLAIVLSVLSLNYFFLQPLFSFNPISYADLVYLTFCTFCALAVGWVSTVRRRTEQELRKTRDELEATVAERTASLRRSEAYLAEAQRLNHCGVTAYNGSTVFYGSEEIYRIWGFDPAQGVPSRKAALQRIHPDDRDRLNAEVERALAEKKRYSTAYRIVLPDGTVKHLESIGQPVFSADGELVEVIATQIDVTERKLTEQALRESEYKLRQIFETVPALLWSLDPDGEVTHVNQRFLDYSGMRLENFKHGGWEALMHPDDYAEIARTFYHAIQTRTSYQDVMRLRRADGEFRWHHVRGEPLRDQKGHIVQWYGVTIDIDERKRAEQALRESEAKIRRLVDSNIIGIFFSGLEGRVLETNDAFLRLVGHDRDDLVSGRVRWTDLTPPEWRERDRRALTELTSNTTAQPYEKEFFRKDGSRVPVLIGGALFEEGGNEGVAFVLDLTELKRAEQALREGERSLRLAIDGIDGLVGVLAPNGELQAANRQLFEYFGRSLEELKNWGTNDTVHPEDLPRILELVKRGVASEIPFNFEVRVRRFDGEYRWFENRHVPILDNSGRIARWYLLLTDIEDRTRALARLEQMQSDFAHMNRVATMDQLTASITHEVKQPITAAVTYALAARRFLSADPPNFREVDDALTLIVKEGNRAGELVERVRALVKKVPARKDAVAIDDAILEVIALARTEAANNSVSVRTQFAEGLPRVQGDRVQLQQVMLNLIVNAIQAMSGIAEGPRELQISIDAVPSGGGVRVGVRDTGPGLSPENLSRLFEPFYTTKPEGMGMGLSICRSIIEAHGGRLWATPCEPRGALFQFTIPAD